MPIAASSRIRGELLVCRNSFGPCQPTSQAESPHAKSKQRTHVLRQVATLCSFCRVIGFIFVSATMKGDPKLDQNCSSHSHFAKPECQFWTEPQHCKNCECCPGHKDCHELRFSIVRNWVNLMPNLLVR